LQYWIEAYGAAYPTFASLRDSFFAEATAGFDGVANEDDLPREVAETLTPSPVAAEFAFFTMRVSAESPTTPPVRASSSAASIASAKDLSLLLLESTRSSLSSEEIVVALGVDGSPSTAAERLTLDEALACRVADGVVDPIAADYL
jgi:hypothetical protein